MAKERYFTRIAVNLDLSKPDFGEARWIASEDVNVEHLLNVFTTVDANSDSGWDACANFMMWHKKRLAILGLRIEGLPDDHRSKPECLFELSWLFESVGTLAERKWLLTHALELWRESGSYHQVTKTLMELSDANRLTGLFEEGIQLARGCPNSSVTRWSRHGVYSILLGCCNDDRQLACRAIDLLPENGEQHLACQSHRISRQYISIQG